MTEPLDPKTKRVAKNDFGCGEVRENFSSRPFISVGLHGEAVELHVLH